MAYWLIEEATGMNRFAVSTYQGQIEVPDLDAILDQLRRYVPIQYIFGHTEWMGLDLQVTPATLVPRPETAELVELIGSRRLAVGGQQCVKVLDVGTGCGCIALALKHRHPDWTVHALDVSPEALAVARANAANLNLDVIFLCADILREDIQDYDIIVSNPPYIRPSEQSTMTENTLRHEPARALFVPEDDPLLFYRRIAQLRRAKELWMEINENLCSEMLALMQKYGYQAECMKDAYGKQRFIHAYY